MSFLWFLHDRAGLLLSTVALRGYSVASTLAEATRRHYPPLLARVRRSAYICERGLRQYASWCRHEALLSLAKQTQELAQRRATSARTAAQALSTGLRETCPFSAAARDLLSRMAASAPASAPAVREALYRCHASAVIHGRSLSRYPQREGPVLLAQGHAVARRAQSKAWRAYLMTCAAMSSFGLVAAALVTGISGLTFRCSRLLLRVTRSLRRVLLPAGAASALVLAAAGLFDSFSTSLLSAASFVEDEGDKGIEILDRNGDQLYLWTEASGGFRRSVSLPGVSPHLINATVSTEDADFWENPGVSASGLARAAYENLAFWETGGLFRGSGGSSITQQLAKNLYVAPDQRYERSASRKLAETYLAMQLHGRYTKEQILERYLNLLFYGNGAYGVEAAAQRYFGKPARQLTLSESAMLAGLPRAPNEYDPLLLPAQRASWPLETLVRLSNDDLVDIGSAAADGVGPFLANFPQERLTAFPARVLAALPAERQARLSFDVQARIAAVDAGEPFPMQPPTGVPNRAAKDRQEYVLDLMVRHGYLNAAEAAAAKAEPLEFRSARFPIQAPHFVLHVLDLLKERLGSQALRGGLRVTTTLNLDLQHLAEQLVAERVAQAGPSINGNNAALVALDPRSGEVLAMVGSADYFGRGIDGQVNMATARRQPGSSFKPFTYATAFLKGYTPGTMLLDAPTRFRDSLNRVYEPQNFDGRYRGAVSVRTALSNSLNVPAVKTIAAVGVDAVLDTARRMGISTLDQEYYGLSVTLGTGEVRLLDLVHAYSAFSNGGKLAGEVSPSAPDRTQGPGVQPVAILRVEDSGGRVLHNFPQLGERQVLPPEIAYLITDILADNEARTPVFGAGLRLPGGRPAGVKTGTTEQLRDFWTVGYTPDLVTGVWMGNANNAPLTGGSSGSTTGPLWEAFMAAAHGDNTHTPFQRPPGIVTARVCATTGQAPTRGCPRVVNEVFPQHLAPALAYTAPSYRAATSSPAPAHSPSRKTDKGKAGR